ncbi:hypothetical protein BGZ79_008723 [Entomortierella chlamydospora]|nr:hypothetical protein BGZ79_008723 [Entomortierella chlamydospora]
MSVMVSLAMLMHLATIGSMIKTKLKANCAANSSCNFGRNSPSSMQSRRQRHLKTARDISLLLKQQWRPGLFAVCLIIMDMVYWLFYFMEAKGLMDLSTTSQEFLNWVNCLSNHMKFAVQSGQLSLVNPTPDQVKAVGQASQTACAYAAEPWVPNIVWAALADMIPALFGVVLLIIFGSRVELWRDLRIWLFGEYNPTTRWGTSKDSLIENPERSVEKRLPVPPRPKYPTPYQDSFLESRSPSTIGSRNGCVVSPKRFSQLIAKTPSPNSDFAYRSDTPEAWKLTPISTQGNGVENLSRVNANNDSHSDRPAVQSNSDSQNKTSLTSTSQHQKRFYNTEDFEALPIFLVTPPPTYHPNNNNSQRGLPLLATDDDLYPDNDVQMAVVSEACRVQLNYRANMDTRYFQQPQVVHQVRSQRGESLPPPVRPRNPARNRPLRASSPALARTQNLTRNDT